MLITIILAFGAGAVFALSLQGEMPPKVLIEERRRLAELRERAQDFVVQTLDIKDKDLALLKGFFLGVVFGVLAAAKYFGVLR